MGRATVISETGAGLYTVQIDYDWARANRLLSHYQQVIDSIDEKIAEEQAKPEPDQISIDVLQLSRAGVEKKIDAINAEKASAEEQVAAWCVDYSEGLSGHVATIEPGTEQKNGIMIRPAYTDGAVHNPDRDGIAYPFSILPVADAMLSFAAMPAIQKWRPTYRVGEISNLDDVNDTCTVNFDAVGSSLQDLDINQTTSLSLVPIDYMACHGESFENGDRVVVEFQGHDWSDPVVIGFESNPEPCGWTEPWDGPSVVSKYPWAYSHSVLDADPPGNTNPATLSIVSGRLVIEVPDTGTVEYFEQQHQLYYIPASGEVFGRTNNIVFNASGSIACLDEDTREQAYWLGIRGYTMTGDVMILNVYVVNNVDAIVADVGYIGCTDQSNSESSWHSETGTVPTSDYFTDDHGKNFIRYSKTVLNNSAAAIQLPETMDYSRAVTVEMLLSMEGGLNPQPGTMPAATLEVDFIGLS